MASTGGREMGKVSDRAVRMERPRKGANGTPPKDKGKSA